MSEQLKPPAEIFIVIFEEKDKPGLKAVGSVYDTWELADAGAKLRTTLGAARAWVMSCPDPRPVAND